MGLLRFLFELFFGPTPPPYRRRAATTHRGGSSRRGVRSKPPTPGQLTGLDTDKFAPLTTDAALDATGQANWRSAYFDSTWVIPPDDVPRIRVIDRTMVGLGLISEKELVQIHDIGREMDQYQSEASAVSTAGEQAVQRSREERARLWAEKRAEAAERKRVRAVAIADRRATDIVYLGRGVSRGLADRRAHVEKLAANGLPVLATPAELAGALGTTISKLRWLAFHSEAPTSTHYVSFRVPKKSGGTRQLSSPHRQIAATQRWILDHVLRPLPTHDAAHGFVPGRSTATNASAHVGADIVVNADLADFFPSITFFRTEGLFRSFGYSPAVATILALLCTECPRETVSLSGETFYPATGPRALPQGACTSPAISNLISRNLDNRLAGIAARLGWQYTRYADDITFSASGEAQQSVGYVLARIRHICQDEGFRVNEKKTRVQRRNTRQSVTGIVVNDKQGVPRQTVRRLRAILHQAKRTGLAAQNRERLPHFEHWLRGMIAYVAMVDPAKGEVLRRDFESL